MSNAASRWRRKRVKEEMRKLKTEKALKEFKEEVVNMSEEELDELAERIAEALNVGIEDVKEGYVKVEGDEESGE